MVLPHYPTDFETHKAVDVPDEDINQMIETVMESKELPAISSCGNIQVSYDGDEVCVTKILEVCIN